MAQLLRSYPARRFGTHNAAVVNPAPNLFLPTGVKVQVAVKRSFVVRQTWRNSTKLRPPTVINPAPNLFLPTGVRSNPNALRRSFDVRRVFRNSTKLRPPTVVIIPVTTIFLPTGVHSKQVAIRQGGLVRRMFNPAADVWNAAIINQPIPFLPRAKVKLARDDQTIARAFRYRARISRPAITALPMIFLPTGPHAARVALQQRHVQVLSTRIHNQIIVTVLPGGANTSGFFLLFGTAV
jgi:hypothetical protein